MITNNRGSYHIMDMCSNETSMKANRDAFFEPLETMKMFLLNHLDVIRFGRETSATFHKSSNEAEVTSSQCTSTNIPCFVPELFGKKSSFYVPDSDALDASKVSQHLVSSEVIEILQTQHELPGTGLNSSGNSLSSGNVLDVISDYDDKSNDVIPMYSQNIFADINSNRSSCPYQHVEEADDEMEDIKEVCKITELENGDRQEGSATPDLEIPRDGSATPDLEFLPIKLEPMSDRSFRQSDIATQLNMEFLETVNVKQELESQILQADIATQAFEDFVDEDDVEFKLRLMEPTQPLFIQRSRTRQQLKRQADIKPKVVSMQDFDDSESTSPPSLKKMKQFLAMETQPFFPVGVEIPRMLKSSQSTTLNKILMSSDDESENEDIQSSVESAKKTQSPLRIIKEPPSADSSPQTPTLNSPLFDTDTPEILPHVPSDSQIGHILDMINASQASNNDSAVVHFEPIIEDLNDVADPQLENLQRHQKVDPIIQPHVRRRIMKYGSFNEDEPSTSKVYKVVPKKNTTPIEPAAELTTYAMAMSNVSHENKEKFQEICVKLGGKVVENIIEADFLLTTQKIKLTSKFLASASKRIPIVSGEFIEASDQAERWLDPFDYIIVDKELESKKDVSLKSLVTSKKKLFKNISVFATKHTVLPTSDLKEIVVNAGGECISTTQKPKYKNVVLIFNVKDSEESAKITKKYPKITKIKDLQLCSIILRNELTVNKSN